MKTSETEFKEDTSTKDIHICSEEKSSSKKSISGKNCTCQNTASGLDCTCEEIISEQRAIRKSFVRSDKEFLNRSSKYWVISVFVNTFQSSFIGFIIILINIIIPIIIALNFYPPGYYYTMILSFQFAQIAATTVLLNLHTIPLIRSLQRTELHSYFSEKYTKYFLIILFISFCSLTYFFFDLSHNLFLSRFMIYLGVLHTIQLKPMNIVGTYAFMVGFSESSYIQIYFNRYLLRARTDIMLRYLYVVAASVLTFWVVLGIIFRVYPLIILSISLICSPLIGLIFTERNYIREIKKSPEFKEYLENQKINHRMYVEYKREIANLSEKDIQRDESLSSVMKEERFDRIITILCSIWGYAKSSTTRSFLLLGSFVGMSFMYTYNVNLSILLGDIFFVDAAEIVLVLGITVGVYLSFLRFIKKVSQSKLEENTERINRLTLLLGTISTAVVCLFLPIGMYGFMTLTGIALLDKYIFLAMPVMIMFGAVSFPCDTSRASFVVLSKEHKKIRDLAIIVLSYVLICFTTIITVFFFYKFLLGFQNLFSYSEQYGLALQIIFCMSLSVFGTVEYLINLVLIRFLMDIDLFTRRFFIIFGSLLLIAVIYLGEWLVVFHLTSISPSSSFFSIVLNSYPMIFFLNLLTVLFCVFVLPYLSLDEKEFEQYMYLGRIFLMRFFSLMRHVLFGSSKKFSDEVDKIGTDSENLFSGTSIEVN